MNAKQGGEDIVQVWRWRDAARWLPVCAAALCSTLINAATEYEVRPIGIFIPTGINDEGWVAGKIDGNYYSFPGVFAGRMRAITSGQVNTSAQSYAVNSPAFPNGSGEVVGSYTYIDPVDIKVVETHAFRFNAAFDAALTDLGKLAGGNASAATAINANGSVVGWANIQNPKGSGYVKRALLYPVTLGDFGIFDGGIESWANGINDAGDIVGAFTKLDGTTQPFLRYASGDVSLLPSIVSSYSLAKKIEAAAINNLGQIMINITLAGGTPLAVLYQKDATWKELRLPNDISSRALGMNQAGQVVGWSLRGDAYRRAFLYDNDPVNPIIDLNTRLPANSPPGLILQEANAINEYGEIVAYTFQYNPSTYLVNPHHRMYVSELSKLPIENVTAPRANDNFGSVIAVNGDTAVIGAAMENGGVGAVHIYRLENSVWREKQILTAPNGKAGDQFGVSVAIKNQTLVVGSAYANSAAYVFERSDSGWALTAPLRSGATTSDGFGAVVATDGQSVVVGVPGVAAYVFRRNGASWEQESKLVPSDSTTAVSFGNAVALDGDTVIVGAPGYWRYRQTSWGPIDSFPAAVYIFHKLNSAWQQQQQLIGTIGTNFGSVVAMSQGTVVIGNSDMRQAIVYKEMPILAGGTQWLEQDTLVNPAYEGYSAFGLSVAIDGDKIIVGEPKSSPAKTQGTAHIFERVGHVWVNKFKFTPSNSALGPSYGTAVALERNTVFVGASAGAGVAYPYTLCPTQQCAPAPTVDLGVEVTATPNPVTVYGQVTYAVTVANHDLNNTAYDVLATSELSNSAAAAFSHATVSAGCSLWPNFEKFMCTLDSLPPMTSKTFSISVAAPSVSGSMTNSVHVVHAGLDSNKGNDSEQRITTVNASGEPRIEIYAPAADKPVSRGLDQSVRLNYSILSWTMIPGGNYSEVYLNGEMQGGPRSATAAQLDLGKLPGGDYTVKIRLMKSDGTASGVVKTISFTVVVEMPSVVIVFPTNAGVDCRKNEAQPVRLSVKYWPLGQSGRYVDLQVVGSEVTRRVNALPDPGSIDLCSLPVGNYSVNATLRDTSNADTGYSTTVAFEVRKAVPKLTVLAPTMDGNNYSNGGFPLVYEFTPGYDPVELSVSLNGSVLSEPLGQSRNNRVNLPSEKLVPGENWLTISISPESKDTPPQRIRFYVEQPATQAAPPSGGGGSSDVLLMIWMARMLMWRRRRIACQSH